jgi:hypothetical protein
MARSSRRGIRAAVAAFKGSLAGERRRSPKAFSFPLRIASFTHAAGAAVALCATPVKRCSEGSLSARTAISSSISALYGATSGTSANDRHPQLPSQMRGASVPTGALGSQGFSCSAATAVAMTIKTPQETCYARRSVHCDRPISSFIPKGEGGILRLFRLWMRIATQVILNLDSTSKPDRLESRSVFRNRGRLWHRQQV